MHSSVFDAIDATLKCANSRRRTPLHKMRAHSSLQPCGRPCVGLVVPTLALDGAAAAPKGPVFAFECVFVAGVLGGRPLSLIAKKTEVPLLPW